MKGRASINNQWPEAELAREGPAQGVVYRHYRRRWIMLLLYSFLNVANAVSWITFAPIQEEAMDYYHTNTVGINLLSQSFMIAYLPGSRRRMRRRRLSVHVSLSLNERMHILRAGSVLATLIYHNWGTKIALLAGGLLTSAGCWLRCVSAPSNAHMRDYGALCVRSLVYKRS